MVLRDTRGRQRSVQRLDLLGVFFLLGRGTFRQRRAAFHQALICALGLGQAFCRGAGGLGALRKTRQRLVTVLIGGSAQPGGFFSLNRATRGQGVNLLHAFGMFGADAAFLANAANFSVTLADTGLLNAEAQDESQGNVVLVLPAPVTARYLRIDLTDGAAPYMDIGLLVAGQLWRLLRGTAYGIREGRVMLDRRDRNPYTGAEFPVPAIVNPRMAAFTLPALSTAEARNQHRDMLRRLGAARDTLWIAELTDSLAERNRRAIWGAMNAPGEDAAISQDSQPLAARGFRVVERV